MKTHIRNAATATALIVSAVLGPATPAHGYQIDCAILLCLAGGWPSSLPCAAARTEFIRRITPFPIEPPLQIWRCPMGISSDVRQSRPLRERLFDVALQGDPSFPVRPDRIGVLTVQDNGQADIDISGTAFDFVRSIRVFHIDYSQAEGRENCIRSDATRLGRYGEQGQYGWNRSAVARVPPASQLSVPMGCSSYAYRSVFVDWRDHAGNYSFEEVRY